MKCMHTAQIQRQQQRQQQQQQQNEHSWGAQMMNQTR